MPKPPAFCPPDKALIQALHDGLRQKYEVGNIEESEYDHEFTCQIGRFKYIISASFDYVDEQWWEVDFQEAPKCFPRLFGQYKEPESKELALAIDIILRKQKWALEIRWYKRINDPPDKHYSPHPIS